MSDESSKQAAPPFTAEDALAFMQKMWHPFGMPMPGSAAGAVEVTEPAPEAASGSAPVATWPGAPGRFAFPNPAAMFAALDPKEVERRIADLRVVEGWLAMSLDVTRMSIRALELQHASLSALHTAHAPPERPKPRRRKE
jgi:hypothetical protein